MARISWNPAVLDVDRAVSIHFPEHAWHVGKDGFAQAYAWFRGRAVGRYCCWSFSAQSRERSCSRC